jgi:hypothetical protein
MSINHEQILSFSRYIEEMVYQNDIPYIDAVVQYCEETGLEIESAAILVSDTLKAKIQFEAEDLHYLPKSNTAKLPF